MLLQLFFGQDLGATARIATFHFSVVTKNATIEGICYLLGVLVLKSPSPSVPSFSIEADSPAGTRPQGFRYLEKKRQQKQNGRGDGTAYCSALISPMSTVRVIHGFIFFYAGTNPGAGLTTSNANMRLGGGTKNSGRDLSRYTYGYDLCEICENLISSKNVLQLG